MYRPVPRIPDFPAMEREILRFWDEQRIFDKLRKQTANGPRWSFLDGPITANNPMGVHHAWGRSLKDMYQRYHAMNGRALRFQNGFDCQGLWVEVEVEKSLGLGTKRDIRQYGIENFVRACKERVLTFAARQTEQSIRLGYWCDWDDPKLLLLLRDALANGDHSVTANLPSGYKETAPASAIVRKLGSAEYGGSYYTFSDENNYTIWAFLKHRTLSDGGGRGPSHHDAYVPLRSIPDPRDGPNRAAHLDHHPLDANLQRSSGRESGDDVPQGPSQRLDLLHRQEQF